MDDTFSIKNIQKNFNLQHISRSRNDSTAKFRIIDPEGKIVKESEVGTTVEEISKFLQSQSEPYGWIGIESSQC